MKRCKTCNELRTDEEMYNYSLYVGKHTKTEGGGYGQVTTYTFENVNKVEVKCCKSCLAKMEKDETRKAFLGVLLVASAIIFILASSKLDNSLRWFIFLPLFIFGLFKLHSGGLLGQETPIFRMAKDIFVSENEGYQHSDFVFFNKQDYKGLKKK